MPTRPAMPAAVTSSPSPWPPFPWQTDYRLAPVIVLPLWMLMIVQVVIVSETNRSANTGICILLLVLLVYIEN